MSSSKFILIKILIYIYLFCVCYVTFLTNLVLETIKKQSRMFSCSWIRVWAHHSTATASFPSRFSVVATNFCLLPLPETWAILIGVRGYNKSSRDGGQTHRCLWSLSRDVLLMLSPPLLWSVADMLLLMTRQSIEGCMRVLERRWRREST